MSDTYTSRMTTGRVVTRVATAIGGGATLGLITLALFPGAPIAAGMLAAAAGLFGGYIAAPRIRGLRQCR